MSRCLHLLTFSFLKPTFLFLNLCWNDLALQASLQALEAVMLYLLYESASGLSLFLVRQYEDIGRKAKGLQAAMADFKLFSSMVELVSFIPFATNEDALDYNMKLAAGEIHDTLRQFLSLNLPAAPADGSKPTFILGTPDVKLATVLSDNMHIPCQTNEAVQELCRGVRTHFVRLIADLDKAKLRQSELALGHAFSRSKVQYDSTRADNMVMQCVALLDQMDKDTNTLAMRVREWYGGHFPELAEFVKDHGAFGRIILEFGRKDAIANADATVRQKLIDILEEDESVADAIISAAKTSMGMDIADVDLASISAFAARVVEQSAYKGELSAYLHDKMGDVAPTLEALVGDRVGARLITRAGSLTNLAKCPASTVQVLGAEKALFRALKTRGRTPKYGLIYHTSFIGRAETANKGRISRFLANKCAIASRIDCFSEGKPNPAFGDALRNQVEERMQFYATGKPPARAIDAMATATHAPVEEIEEVPLPVAAPEASPVAEEVAPSADLAVRPKKSSKKAKTGKKKSSN
jgi:nucleolar protein 56